MLHSLGPKHEKMFDLYYDTGRVLGTINETKMRMNLTVGVSVSLRCISTAYRDLSIQDYSNEYHNRKI